MEDADGIAQWNASGSRKKSIVAAGSQTEQLTAPPGRMKRGECGCQNGKAGKATKSVCQLTIYYSLIHLIIEIKELRWW
jgi:hypothetical protein